MFILNELINALIVYLLGDHVKYTAQVILWHPLQQAFQWKISQHCKKSIRHTVHAQFGVVLRRWKEKFVLKH